ncbi:aldo/keto reductase [Teichococcus aestuarii]|uniref:aldo/keto reductase n=1 Tax=Teichococcus aestuarii TaxID=568898 RepID=UPI0036188692
MSVETRRFGPDGLSTSLLGFGCGGVGGLMVRGAVADQERAIARALEAGINYFDTAVQYGNGASEQNLGNALRRLKAGNALIGTKVRLRSDEFGNIAAAVAASLEGSLRRLQRDQADIFYLHNEITLHGGGEKLSLRQVLEEVVPAFQSLQAAGKLRLPGWTAVGETEALHQVVDAGFFGGAQVIYNMLNPSAGTALPTGHPAQDYRQLLNRMQEKRMGAVGIRVLAGGALSGSAQRHPVASPRRSRWVRDKPMRTIWARRPGCCRWWPRASRPPCQKLPFALRLAIPRWERSWSAWPVWRSSRPHSRSC